MSTQSQPTTSKQKATSSQSANGSTKSKVAAAAKKAPTAKPKVAAKSKVAAAAKPKVTTNPKNADESGTAPVATGIEAWISKFKSVSLPTVDLAEIEIPVVQLPNLEWSLADLSALDLPTTQIFDAISVPTGDQVRLSVVKAIDDVQDAVMTAPVRAHEMVIDLRAGMTRSVILLRETVGV